MQRIRTLLGARPHVSRLLAGFVLVVGLGLAGYVALRPALAARRDATQPPIATFAPVAAINAAPSHTATALPTATLTHSATPSATATATRTPTMTATPSPTPTPTAAPTETATPSPTAIPLPTPDGITRILRVPILMYHYVSTPPGDANTIRKDLSVSPERFDAHLRYLRDEGYEAITLNDLALTLQMGLPLPPKPIVLTFDDGYADHYEVAFPLLRHHGHVGTFFVITGFIDEEREGYLTWEQVTKMHEAGMRIEAHGHTHPDLRNRSVDYLVWQVLGAKEAIEARTHEPVRFFCYPSGKYDDQVIRVLHSAHYWGAVTVNPGMEHDSNHLFEIKRVRVHGAYTAQQLAAALDATDFISASSTLPAQDLSYNSTPDDMPANDDTSSNLP